MRTIPAREIKRRGIGAVDEALREGPVHVIRNDEPAYVILTGVQYEELMADRHEAYLAHVRESLEDMKHGRFRVTTAQELIDEFGLED